MLKNISCRFILFLLLPDGGGTEVVTTPTSPQPASGSDPLRHPPKGPRLGFGDIFKDGSGKLKPKVSNQTEENNPVSVRPA